MTNQFILLIEDNADDAYLATRVIAKLWPDKVMVARDGEEACDLLQKMAEDASYKELRLIFLDLKLPKVSGIEVLQTIRTTPLLSNLPVVVLTSSDNDLDQEKCRELGILDYIYKPMTVERLQRTFPSKDA